MRKIILLVVLLGIFAVSAVDVSFVDNIFLGQTKVYRVGDENLTARLLYFSESEIEGSKVILGVNGEETKLLAEEEEEVVLEGRVIVRIYDILSSDKKVRFGILGSGFSEDTQKSSAIPGNAQKGANKASSNESNKNLSLENFTSNETDRLEENLSDENEILEDVKDVVNEQSVLWKSADVKENRVGFFVKIWRWFISLFGF